MQLKIAKKKRPRLANSNIILRRIREEIKVTCVFSR